jgi:hypothetical protein
MNQSEQRGSIVLWDNTVCLLEELAQELIALGKENCESLHIVFPTQRLATVLLARLAKEWGAFYPPSTWTIESFIVECAKKNGFRQSEQVLDDLFLETLLSHLIKDGEYQYLKQGCEHELKEFFSQLIETRQEQRVFADIIELYNQDVYQSESVLKNLICRTKEIEDIFIKCMNSLDNYNIAFRDKIIIDSVSFLEECIAKKSLVFSRVYIVGFTTLKDYLFTLLAKMVDECNTYVWVSKEADIFSRYNPLKYIKKSILEKTKNDIKIISQRSSVTKKYNIYVNACENIDVEINKALDKMEHFIKNGASPSQLALLIPDESVYGNLVRAEIKRRDLDANIALSYSIDNSVFGRWFCLLLKFVFSGGRGFDLLALLRHPLTSLDEKNNNSQRYKELTYALFDINLPSGVESIRKNLETLGSQVIELFDIVINKLSPILKILEYPSEKKEFKLWKSVLAEVIGNFSLFEKQEDKKHLDSFEIYNRAMENIIPIDIKLNSNEIYNYLLKKIMKLESRSVGYPLKGIQVIALTEARYVPFEAIILLGCVESIFPKSLPQDVIVDDWLKRKLGLRGWQYIEALEDTTFKLLIERVAYIEIFYPKRLEDKPTVPSRFIERLKWENKAQIVEHFNSCLDSVRDENKIARKFISQVSLEVNYREDLVKAISASSLKLLFTCPYRYLYHCLGVRKWKGTENLDYLREGKLLHAVIESFYTGRYQNIRIVEPLGKVYLSKSLNKLLLDRIKKITNYIIDFGEYSFLTYHLYEYSWPKFIDFVASFYKDDGSGNSYISLNLIEKEFVIGRDDKRYIPIVAGGREYSISVNARVDSVEASRDSFFIIDYKRRAASSGSAGVFGEDPQLIFYAYVLSLQGKSIEVLLDNTIVAYWNIIESKLQIKAKGSKFQNQHEIFKFSKSINKNLGVQVKDLKSSIQKVVSTFLEKDTPINSVKSRDCESCVVNRVCKPSLHIK